MGLNMLTSLFTIYYEDIWNPESSRYLPGIIRNGYGQAKSGLGPFDPISLPLSEDWVRLLGEPEAEEPILAAFKKWRDGRLEINGLSSIRAAGKPVFLAGLSRIVFPLLFEELELRLIPGTGNPGELRVTARDFYFQIIAGLHLGADTLIRPQSLHLGDGVWKVSAIANPAGQEQSIISGFFQGETLSAHALEAAVRALNCLPVLKKIERFINTAIRVVLLSQNP